MPEIVQLIPYVRNLSNQLRYASSWVFARNFLNILLKSPKFYKDGRLGHLQS